MNVDMDDLDYAQSLGWRTGVIDAEKDLPAQTTIDCGASPKNPWHVAYSRGYLAGWQTRYEQLRRLRGVVFEEEDDRCPF